MSQKSNIAWTIEALNDFEDYIDWYLEHASFKVASEFVENIEGCLDVIINDG